jgi:hypothetical protein
MTLSPPSFTASIRPLRMQRPAPMPRHATEDAAALAMAHQRTAQAEERLAELKAMLEDLRQDRDAWRDQAQRLALPSPQSSRSWWRWLRSTG